MARQTGFLIGGALARGMKTLGQALTVQAAEKRRRTEQEQKEEDRRRQAEEKEESKRLRAIEQQAEEALSELSFFESIGDEQGQEALFNFNLARTQAGLPPAPLGQQRLKVVKERAEQMAEEEQERQQQEQLAQGFQAFGKSPEELGVHVPESLEQQPLDFSGMFTETMGITPADFGTPTGTQEAAEKMQEVINQLPGMRPSEFDEPHELERVGQTALEKIQERAVIEAAFAGKKAKVRAEARGLTPAQRRAEQAEVRKANKLEIATQRNTILTGATKKYQASVDVATRKKLGIMSIDSRADLEKVLSKAGKPDFWAKITKGMLGRDEPPEWWFELHDMLTQYNEVPTIFKATDEKGKPTEVIFDVDDMSLIEEIMSARGL